VLEERLRHAPQRVAVLGQESGGPLVLLGDDPLDLGIDLEASPPSSPGAVELLARKMASSFLP